MVPAHEGPIFTKKFHSGTISLMLGVVHWWQFVNDETNKNNCHHCQNLKKLEDLLLQLTLARSASLLRPEREKCDAKNSYLCHLLLRSRRENCVSTGALRLSVLDIVKQWHMHSSFEVHSPRYHVEKVEKVQCSERRNCRSNALTESTANGWYVELSLQQRRALLPQKTHSNGRLYQYSHKVQQNRLSCLFAPVAWADQCAGIVSSVTSACVFNPIPNKCIVRIGRSSRWMQQCLFISIYSNQWLSDILEWREQVFILLNMFECLSRWLSYRINSEKHLQKRPWALEARHRHHKMMRWVHRQRRMSFRQKVCLTDSVPPATLVRNWNSTQITVIKLLLSAIW